LLRHGDRFLDLVRIAKRQKAMLYCIFASIVATAILGWMAADGSPTLAVFGTLIYATIWIVTAIYFARLAIATGQRAVVVFFACIALALPITGLVVLLNVNRSATSYLQMGGVRVGLLGVSERELVKLYAGACSNCGYSLRDLQGNLCPECGKPVTM
jgi:hypothetical protein